MANDGGAVEVVAVRGGCRTGRWGAGDFLEVGPQAGGLRVADLQAGGSSEVDWRTAGQRGVGLQGVDRQTGGGRVALPE